jgi:hypothetical protein
MGVCYYPNTELDESQLTRLAILKLTPLRNANVPPPMALHELQIAGNAIDVAHGDFSTRMIVLDRNGVTAYEYSITSKSAKEPTLIERFQLPEECGIPIQIAMKADEEVYLLSHKAEINRDEVHFRGITDGHWTQISLDEEHVASIFPSQSYDGVYSQSSQGSIARISSSPGHGLSVKLPALCPWTELVDVGDEVWDIISASLVSDLTGLANHLWPYFYWEFVRKLSTAGVELHLLSCHTCTSHFHNHSASSEIRTLELEWRYVNNLLRMDML